MPAVATLLGLIPHQGRMCLLDRVEQWTPTEILCRTRSHLDPANPLRRAGRLAALCGIEYGLQAAAAHGALAAPPALAGWLAAIRSADIAAPWLDEPDFGELAVAATLLHRDANGFIYSFTLHTATGELLLTGSGTIKVPPASFSPAPCGLGLRSRPRLGGGVAAGTTHDGNPPE